MRNASIHDDMDLMTDILIEKIIYHRYITFFFKYFCYTFQLLFGLLNLDENNLVSFFSHQLSLSKLLFLVFFIFLNLSKLKKHTRTTTIDMYTYIYINIEKRNF